MLTIICCYHSTSFALYLPHPYFYFGMKIVYMHLAAFIFNTGVNIYLLLYLCTYNTKRIDLSKASAMNYQGTTFKSFLIVLPIMFVPMILVTVTPSHLFLNDNGLMGTQYLRICGHSTRQPILSLCVNQFNSRKYKLAEGFRQGVGLVDS